MLSQGGRNLHVTSTTLELNESSTESRHLDPIEPVKANTFCTFAEPKLGDKKGWEPLDGT